MSELLKAYSDFLKQCFKKRWKIDINSWDDSTRNKYKSPEYPSGIKKEEIKKYIVGNYLAWLYPHFYKVNTAFKKILGELNIQKEYTSLTSSGNKYILDIGAGLLTGTLAYCDFLNKSLIEEYPINIYVIANEPDSLKTGFLHKNEGAIIDLVREKTNGHVNLHIEYINEPFPDSKDEIIASLKQRRFFKELIIINACIVKWIDFSPDTYAELSAFSDRTHLINVEPYYENDTHGIREKLKKLSEFNNSQIDKILSISTVTIPYDYPNHPDGPFRDNPRHTSKFMMSYYYSINLQNNFFTSARLKEAYYKIRQNIINSRFYDRIGTILFDSHLDSELNMLSERLSSDYKFDYKFALTLDYKVHKNKKEDGGYNFRYMSARKIDNEIISAAIINPISETDSYIEDTHRKKCSYGNRLAIQSKNRFYSYFLEDWLAFREKALSFAKENGYSIFQYDIEKYYENIGISKLQDNLYNSYIRPKKNDHVKKLTDKLLKLKCYTTTKKENCTECSYEDRHHKDCSETYGLPQGPISSGFYANIYLYPLDEAMIVIPGYGNDFIYLRYVDDILIVTSSEKINEIEAVLKRTGNELGLKISSEKADKKVYTPEEFEQESLSNNIVNLCKKASAFLDLYFYVPSEYYDKREDTDFLKKYIRCLAEIGIHIPNKETVSKKLNDENKYSDNIDFKEKRFGRENVNRIKELKGKFKFPSATLVESPSDWCKCFISNNHDVVSEYKSIKKDIYAVVLEIFNKLTGGIEKQAVREMRTLLYRAKYFYKPKYKDTAKQLLDSYRHVAPYDVVLDLISGTRRDSHEYLIGFLKQLISVRESLKDNYLLATHVIRHLADYYQDKKTFVVLVDTISKFFEVSDIEPDKNLINEAAYKIKYPSGYLILLLSITDGILHIPYDHWTADKKSILFQHLQTLLSVIHVEQIYKHKNDRIIYSFKKSLKINIVTIMAKILGSSAFVDLNLTATIDDTNEDTRNTLKRYVEGSFSFENYILSIPESHNPDEYIDEGELIY